MDTKTLLDTLHILANTLQREEAAAKADIQKMRDLEVSILGSIALMKAAGCESDPLVTQANANLEALRQRRAIAESAVAAIAPRLDNYRQTVGLYEQLLRETEAAPVEAPKAKAARTYLN